jgi:uncharacterized protein YeaO (DUF488 family)
VRVGRLYDDVADGTSRVLVDRLWPRGVRRDDPRAGLWLKDAAPSDELRHWYGHDAGRHEEFVRRYTDELHDESHAEAVRRIRALVDAGEDVELVTATKDVAVSHVPVLAAFVEEGAS